MTMDCDLCNSRDLNAVLILRRQRFRNPKGKLANNISRVCPKCAKKLDRDGVYYLGDYWSKLFERATYL